MLEELNVRCGDVNTCSFLQTVLKLKQPVGSKTQSKTIETIHSQDQQGPKVTMWL